MTFREKLEKDHMGWDKSQIRKAIENNCPFEFGYEDQDAVEDDCYVSEVGCEICWNREIPTDETEESLKILEAHKKAYESGLNDGRNEVWEFLDRIEHAIKSSVLIEVFGYSNIGDILDHFKPQEALAKLKAYEEAKSKIEVGDVVLMHRQEAVVTRVVDQHANILFRDGVTNNVPVKDLVGNKTGKRIDIKSFLEQIGE